MAIAAKKLRALTAQQKKDGMGFGKPLDDEDEDMGEEETPIEEAAEELAEDESEEDDAPLAEGDEGDQDESADIAIANEVGLKVIDGDVDDDVVALMADYQEGDKPAWAVDGDIWERALVAVDPDGEGADSYDEPYLVVAHTYAALGGKIDEAIND